MKTFTAQFGPDDYVIIKALERPGRVSLVRFDGRVTEYYVAWWDEGKRCVEWLAEDELEAQK